MSALLTELLMLPTAVFTVLMAISLLYWLFVIFGAVGIETFDIDVDGVLDGAMDGAVGGVLDGAVDGAVDGAADGVVESALDGAVDGVGEGMADGVVQGGGGSHGLAWYVVHALALQKAPATVVFTVLVFWCWVFSFLGMHFGAGAGELAPGVGAQAGVTVVALALATLFTNRTVKPLGRLFETREAARRSDSVGGTCVVRTGRVTATFGQAEIQDGGAGLLVEVRCDEPNALKRGDTALVVDFDSKAEAYAIEPMDRLLDSGGDPGGEDDLERELGELGRAASSSAIPEAGNASRAAPHEAPVVAPAQVEVEEPM